MRNKILNTIAAIAAALLLALSLTSCGKDEDNGTFVYELTCDDGSSIINFDIVSQALETPFTLVGAKKTSLYTYSLAGEKSDCDRAISQAFQSALKAYESGDHPYDMEGDVISVNRQEKGVLYIISTYTFTK